MSSLWINWNAQTCNTVNYALVYNVLCIILFRPALVNLFLHPSTGDDDHDSKYVCVNLLLSIPEDYPLIPPGISIKNPRGLSDAHITR